MPELCTSFQFAVRYIQEKKILEYHDIGCALKGLN